MKKTIYFFALWMSFGTVAQAQFPTDLENIFQDILDQYFIFSGSKGISVAIFSENETWAAAKGLHSTNTALTDSSTFAMGLSLIHI